MQCVLEQVVGSKRFNNGLGGTKCRTEGDPRAWEHGHAEQQGRGESGDASNSEVTVHFEKSL